MTCRQFNEIRSSLELMLQEATSRMMRISIKLKQSVPCPDEIDRGVLESEHRLLIAKAEQEGRIVRNIKSALRKMDSGEYGICEGCGDDISPRRLEVLPAVRYCTDCQELLDSATNKTEHFEVQYDLYENIAW